MTDDEFMAAERDRFERIGRRTGRALTWSVVIAIGLGLAVLAAWSMT